MKFSLFKKKSKQDGVLSTTQTHKSNESKKIHDHHDVSLDNRAEKKKSSIDSNPSKVLSTSSTSSSDSLNHLPVQEDKIYRKVKKEPIQVQPSPILPSQIKPISFAEPQKNPVPSPALSRRISAPSMQQQHKKNETTRSRSFPIISNESITVDPRIEEMIRKIDSAIGVIDDVKQEIIATRSKIEKHYLNLPKEHFISPSF